MGLIRNRLRKKDNRELYRDNLYNSRLLRTSMTIFLIKLFPPCIQRVHSFLR